MGTVTAISWHCLRYPGNIFTMSARHCLGIEWTLCSLKRISFDLQLNLGDAKFNFINEIESGRKIDSKMAT